MNSTRKEHLFGLALTKSASKRATWQTWRASSWKEIAAAAAKEKTESLKVSTDEKQFSRNGAG